MVVDRSSDGYSEEDDAADDGDDEGEDDESTAGWFFRTSPRPTLNLLPLLRTPVEDAASVYGYTCKI